MLRSVALGLAVGFALTAPAFAADVIRPVVTPPRVVVQANPLAGFYLGGHVGHATANRHGCFDDSFPVDVEDCDEDDEFNYNQRGWIIGGQTGYNHFFGFGAIHGLFIGGEVTASLSGITGNLESPPDDFEGPGDWNWLATGTVKLGWAFANIAAIYGEWGVGLGGFHYGGALCNIDSNNQGTVWGFGAEAAVSSNNSVFIEWNRYDFRAKDAQCNPTGLGIDNVAVNTKPRVDVVRFGFNHYFN
jgi:opacity protein-like surface antigen